MKFYYVLILLFTLFSNCKNNIEVDLEFNHLLLGDWSQEYLMDYNKGCEFFISFTEKSSISSFTNGYSEFIVEKDTLIILSNEVLPNLNTKAKSKSFKILKLNETELNLFPLNPDIAIRDSLFPSFCDFNSIDSST